MNKERQYINNQLRNKVSSNEIIESLVSSGYSREKAQIKVYMAMSIKYLKLPTYIILGLLILLFMISFFDHISTKTYTSDDIFPQDPAKWVIKEQDQFDTIDVSAITKGYSHIEGGSQIYSVPLKGYETVFEINGFFEGVYFDEKYVQEDITLMRVSNTMTPGDGIIEGYIVEKINDADTGNITAFIFVDSDWRQKLPQTKVFWGSRYQYYTDYQFNEISPGIYMFKIYDDPNRHQDNFAISSGGIAVGNIGIENIINNDIENKTFMRLYS